MIHTRIVGPMKVSLIPMSREHATELVSWRYDPPYDIYGHAGTDIEETIAYLIGRKNQFFAAVQDRELVGFRSFGHDGQVEGGYYTEPYLDTGGGLRPDLTGKGLGAEFVRTGLQFGSEKFLTERFRVTVASFNERALKVCRKVGYVEDQRFRRTTDGLEFTVLTIDGL